MNNGDFEHDYDREVNPSAGPLGKCLAVMERRDESPETALALEMHMTYGWPEDECADCLKWLQEQGFRRNGGVHADWSYAEWMNRLVDILRYLWEHRSLTALFAVLYIWDNRALDDICGHRSQEKFAHDNKVEPAAVNNAVIEAQKHFGTPPRKDQRKMEARQEMSNARIRQLPSKERHL